jgi:hypothetical protein
VSDISKQPADPGQWRSRIIGAAEIDPTTITPNPANARRHPPRQRRVLRALLDQVGVVQDVIINQRTGYLIDGHLRVEVALETGQPTIPVKYVDLTEEEEALALATFDPIGALAYLDIEAMTELAEAIGPVSDEIDDLLAELTPEKPSYDYEPPEPAADPFAGDDEWDGDGEADDLDTDGGDSPDPDDTPTDTATLWIAQTGVPMTAPEYRELVDLYQRYVESRGMTFGFAGWVFRAVQS